MVSGLEDDRFGGNMPPRAQHAEIRADLTSLQFTAGMDERRMHVRAYNHWVSLLRGRDYPAIEDLDPARIADFGPNSVLLDFTTTLENPAIVFLGRALRAECALDRTTTHIAQVPDGSLLSRLTDHYRQIIADRAPIGFEAEFVSTRGHNTLYRGILMPFSSDGATIDYLYGVINWKELVDSDTQARLYAEIAAARRTPVRTATAPVWADGPGQGLAGMLVPDIPGVRPVAPSAVSQNGTLDKGSSLSERLAAARDAASAFATADADSRTALHEALARALDFTIAADADPHGYETLLAQAEIAVQLRAPMTPVVELVFGTDADPARLARYAAVLTHARSLGVPAGGLPDLLTSVEGGIEPIGTARPSASSPPPALASVALQTGSKAGDYIVLLARSGGSGSVEIVATVTDDSALTERVMQQALR